MNVTFLFHSHTFIHHTHVTCHNFIDKHVCVPKLVSKLLNNLLQKEFYFNDNLIHILLAMSDTEYTLSSKTWHRSMEPVSKIGFMDGASDGQTAVFQQSFNTGYEQGLSFGLELGFRHATLSTQQKSLPELHDARKINCQICTNNIKPQENVGNLYNIQKEKNSEYLMSSKENNTK